MNDFEIKDKDKLLIDYGYKFIDGYAMNYSAPETDNIIISVDEIKRFVCKNPTRFYFASDDFEYALDLEQAWESLCEDIYMQNDMKNDDELDAYLLNKLNNKLLSNG